MRRIAKNPVSGVAAISVVTLDIMKKESEGSSEPTWSTVAMAFAPDYINLFYVDLDTDHYIEYSPDGDGKDLSLERRGENFFEASRREATRIIAAEDRDRFVHAFTKENIVREIEENGSFTIRYNLIVDGKIIKAVMEAVRLMSTTENTLVIGASRDTDGE